jgi:adsorption protein B
LTINAFLLGWRILVRVAFVTAAYGLKQGLLSVPRLVVGNVIAILAVKRALTIHADGGPKRWDKTPHIFPVEESAA